LRLAVGTRLPAGLYPAFRASRALSPRAAHCPHRDGGRHDTERDRPAPAIAPGRSCWISFAPSTPATRASSIVCHGGKWRKRPSG
jgi:hypothetical protein